MSKKHKSLLSELELSYGGSAGEKNSPHSKIFLMFPLSLSIT